MIITGGNGLLGSTFKGNNVELHNREKANLLEIDKSFIYFQEMRKKHDTIIHTAAKVGGVKANMDNNELFFRENKIINDTVIELAKYLDYKNMVTILSTCIFPNDNVNYPLTSDQIENGKPHNSNYGYSYAKRLLNYQTKMYRDMTGNNWYSIIPTNLYGENDNYDINNGHIIPSLIHKAYLADRDGTSFEVWGDGTPLRQFMFVEDLRDITLWSVDNWKQDKPLMAVNEKEHTIKEVVDIISDRFNIKNTIYNRNMPKGQHKKPAKSDLPNWEYTSLEEGINKTIDYFIKNYENVRK